MMTETMYTCYKTKNCSYKTNTLGDLEYHTACCRLCCCDNERNKCPYLGSPYDFYNFHQKCCKYYKCSIDGCQFLGTSVDVNTHTLLCEYRLLPCDLCGKKFCAYKLDDHLKKCSDTKMDCYFCGEFYGDRINKDLWKAHYLKCLPPLADAFDKFVAIYGKDITERLLIKGFENKITESDYRKTNICEIKPFVEIHDGEYLQGITDQQVLNIINLIGIGVSASYIVKKSYLTLLVREGFSKCIPVD